MTEEGSGQNEMGSKRELAIKGLHLYRERILEAMAKLREDLVVVERSIVLLSDKCDSVIDAGTGIAAYLKPQEAALRFLEDNPGKRFKASEVSKELLRRGLHTTAKSVTSLVTSCLNRLSLKGLIGRDRSTGVWRYWLDKELDDD